MVDTNKSSGDVVAAVAPAANPKKVKMNVTKKPSHPKTSEMVNNAIKDLKERGCSSLQAIKKFIAANYMVDAEKMAPFVKRYLKAAVTSGALVQTKGKGASGSFKLAVTRKDSSNTATNKSVKKSPVAKTTTATKKPLAPKIMLLVSTKSKKTAAEAKKAIVKTKTSTHSKAKKTTKVPTKPKTPKPKMITSVKSAKKSTPNKK